MSGLFFLLLFVAGSALRDVYFGQAFHALGFFELVLLTFSLCTAVFAAVALARSRREAARLKANLPAVLGMNAATALAWVSYFFALGRLEPAVANTLFSGMGPLTVVGLGAIGMPIAGPSRATGLERAGLAGIGIALVFLAWAAVSGLTGLGGSPLALAEGVACAVLSGASIAVAILFSKRLHDRGIGPEWVLATRFLGAVGVAATALLLDPAPTFLARAEPAEIATLSAAVLLLIVLPVYAMQLGLARMSPLTAETAVFLLQALDDRIAQSPHTLAGIALYSACCVAAVWARAAAEREAARRPAPAACPGSGR